MDKIRRIYGKFVVGLVLIKNIRNWISVFANYIGIKREKYITHKLRDGSVIKIRRPEKKGETSGLANIYEILLIKNYNPKGMEIKNNDVVIDIGANIGVFTIYASLLSKGGKIYAFEPFKTHFNRLLENIKINNFPNVKAFNLAVCGSKGKRDLYISNISSGMHSLFFEGSGKRVSVECTTLKEIFDSNRIKKCNFLKLDCEGAEYEILYNTPNNVFKKIDKIALEWDNLDNKKMNVVYLKNFLEKRGFKVNINGMNQKAGILYAKK